MDFVVKRYFYFLIDQGTPLLVVIFISKAVVLEAGGAGGADNAFKKECDVL